MRSDACAQCVPVRAQRVCHNIGNSYAPFVYNGVLQKMRGIPQGDTLDTSQLGLTMGRTKKHSLEPGSKGHGATII